MRVYVGALCFDGNVVRNGIVESPFSPKVFNRKARSCEVVSAVTPVKKGSVADTLKTDSERHAK